MRYFVCTVYVAVPDQEHKTWSEGADETFNLANAVNDVGGYGKSLKYDKVTCHLADHHEVRGDEFRVMRGKTITADGGI